MLQHVNKIFTGEYVSGVDTTALTPGQITLVDANGAAVTDFTKVDRVKAAKAIGTQDITMKDGTVTTIPSIIYSDMISNKMVEGFTSNPYTAPVEDVITVDLTNVVIHPTRRYVLKIYYRDLYELVSMFTRSYEAFVDAADTTATLATKLAAAINRTPERRVTATVAGSVITLTALPKTDNEGVNAINEYTQVSMEASLYYTNAFDSMFFNNYYQDAAAIVTKTVQANPGDGNWKVVRDRMKWAMPYKGVINKTAFPVIAPALDVDPTAQYDTTVLQYRNLYQSNDNQYVKETPLTVEFYTTAGSDALSTDLTSFVGYAPQTKA